MSLTTKTTMVLDGMLFAVEAVAVHVRLVCCEKLSIYLARVMGWLR